MKRGSITLSILLGLAVVGIIAASTDEIIRRVFISESNALRVSAISGGGGEPSGPAGGDLTGEYPNPTIAANAVTLGTDTNGNYAAGDAEAGAATSGDSATGFFGSGTMEPARLGSGTPDNTVFLRGDGAWAAPSGGGSVIRGGEVAVCDDTVAASAWSLFTSLKPVPTCVTGTNTQKAVMSFTDSDGDFQMQRAEKVPTGWDGTLDINGTWYANTTSNAVVWQVATICVADGETDDPSFNTASTVTETAKGTANQLNNFTISSVTTTGCAADETMHIKFFRNRTHASDTLTVVPLLTNVEMVF